MSASSSLVMSPRGFDITSLLPASIAEIVSASSRTSPPVRASPALLAFWRRNTRQLASFNSSFAALIHMPPTVLTSRGATWDNFLLPSEVAKVEALLATGLKPSESRSLGLHIVAADGSVRICTISIALILTNGDEEELLWTIVPDYSVICDSVAPLVFSQVTISPRLPEMPRRYSHGSSFSGSEEEEADSTEVAPFITRELVPATVRSRNPWDMNVTKFSLKEKRRGSNNVCDVPAVPTKRRANSPDPMI